jgi:hypothetical protein
MKKLVKFSKSFDIKFFAFLKNTSNTGKYDSNSTKPMILNLRKRRYSTSTVNNRRLLQKNVVGLGIISPKPCNSGEWNDFLGQFLHEYALAGSLVGTTIILSILILSFDKPKPAEKPKEPKENKPASTTETKPTEGTAEEEEKSSKTKKIIIGIIVIIVVVGIIIWVTGGFGGFGGSGNSGDSGSGDTGKKANPQNSGSEDKGKKANPQDSGSEDKGKKGENTHLSIEDIFNKLIEKKPTRLVELEQLLEELAKKNSTLKKFHEEYHRNIFENMVTEFANSMAKGLNKSEAAREVYYKMFNDIMSIGNGQFDDACIAGQKELRFFFWFEDEDF